MYKAAADSGACMSESNFDILLVEDDADSLAQMQTMLQGMGRVIACRDAGSARALLEDREFDLVMTDLHTGGKGELSLLSEVKRAHPNTVVIIISDSEAVERAVEAMRRGAFDYITKPYTLDHVAVLVQKAKAKRLMRLELEELRELVRNRRGPQLIGKSEAMQELKRRIARVAPLDCTVLVTGETGTGKELVSQAIHSNSRRADQKFLAVNCGAFSEDLLCNELFGHEREAFTGAQRTSKGVFETLSGGTVLLDEIGEAPPSAQVQLLRVLQEKTVIRVGGVTEISVDVRVIAATNRSLEKEVTRGGFRQDLFYRLNVVTLRIPPLRERREDIPLFCHHFLTSAAERYQMAIPRLTDNALQTLLCYPYPGNVRELKNILERSMILADGPVINLKSLPARVREAGQCVLPDSIEAMPTLAALEEAHIRRVVELTGGNKAQAARVLGIDRASLWRKLKKMGEA